jgi:hypothetical protein
MEWFDVYASLIIIAIILSLKAVIRNSMKSLKTLLAEAPIDIATLCLSLNISFAVLFSKIEIFRTVENFRLCFIMFLVQIFVLILIVFASNKLMLKYNESEKYRYFILCLGCTYIPSVPLLVWSIYNVIRNTCQNVDLKCLRGDEKYRENEILSHILKEIVPARVVIVNINGRSPNVLYELGICHAIGKQVIMLSRNTNDFYANRSDFPFDIGGKSILIYDSCDELKEKLRNELLKLFIAEE